MATALRKLASCSRAGELKVWEVPVQRPVQSLRPHIGSVNSVAWNHTGLVIATAGDDGLIVLTRVTDGKELCRLLNTKGPSTKEMLNAVAFGQSSRLIVAGGTAKLVRVWDTVKQDLLNSFEGHTQAITSIDVDRGESCVASGSEGGVILIHNLSSGVSGPQFRVSGSQPITAIQYHPLDRTRLGAVTKDGSLYVWNTQTATEHMSFKRQHVGSATGLAFSSHNHMLMCTAGMDKRLVLYDVEQAKVLKQITAPEELTSLSFMDDGCTIAVGSYSGSIFLYDLRSPNDPTHSFLAHVGLPITALGFQPKGVLPLDGKGSASSTRSSSRSGNTGSGQKKSTTPMATSTPARLQGGVQSGSRTASAPSSAEPQATGQQTQKSEQDAASSAASATHTPAGTTPPIRQPRFVSPQAGHQGANDLFSPLTTPAAKRTATRAPSGLSSASRPQPAVTTAKTVSPPTETDAAASEANEPPVKSILKSRAPYEPFAGLPRHVPGPEPASVATRQGTPPRSKPHVAHHTAAPAVDAFQPGADRDDRARQTTPLNGGLPSTTSYSSQQRSVERDYATASASGSKLGATTTTLSSAHAGTSGAASSYGVSPATEFSSGPTRPSYRAGGSGFSSSAADAAAPSRSPAVPASAPLSAASAAQAAQPPTQTQTKTQTQTQTQTFPTTSARAPLEVAPGVLSATHPLQAEFIRNMVESSLDDFRLALHRDVQNMHLELLRQFELQKNELRQMMESYSPNKMLLAELQRLRRENQSLQVKY